MKGKKNWLFAAAIFLLLAQGCNLPATPAQGQNRCLHLSAKNQPIQFPLLFNIKPYRSPHQRRNRIPM